MRANGGFVSPQYISNFLFRVALSQAAQHIKFALGQVYQKFQMPPEELSDMHPVFWSRPQKFKNR